MWYKNFTLCYQFCRSSCQRGQELSGQTEHQGQGSWIWKHTQHNNHTFNKLCTRTSGLRSENTLNTIIIQQINLTSAMLSIGTTGLKFTVQKPWTSLSHPNYFELVRNSSLLVSSWHFLLRNKIKIVHALYFRNG